MQLAEGMTPIAPSTHRLVTPRIEYDLRRDLLSSVFAGQLAGLIMAVAMVLVFTLILRTPWYHPVQVIGAFALGDQALPGTFHLPGFLAGLVIHQLVASLLWSLVFGGVINRLQHTWTNVLATGLAIGVASQVIDTNFIVPAIMTGLHGHNIWAENVPQLWSWISHLVFGAGFVLFLPIREKLTDARHPAR